MTKPQFNVGFHIEITVIKNCSPADSGRSSCLVYFANECTKCKPIRDGATGVLHNYYSLLLLRACRLFLRLSDDSRVFGRVQRLGDSDVL